MRAYNRIQYRSFLIFVALSVCTITMIYHINLFLQNNSFLQMAYGHQTSKYGNFTLEYGWAEEPVLIDEINNIVVGVTKDSENRSLPVRNALGEMDIQVKYGGVTKELSFVPSQEEAGLYEAEILPTRLGSYGLVVNGTIDGQVINDEVQIEDVESKQKISFPEAESGGSGTSNDATNFNLLSGQISNILNQITNDINNIRDDIGTLAEGNSDIQERIQDVKDIADRAYMLAITAIGVGAAGILIGAVVLSRR